ncbi:MAG TPA: prepilin-type N-terminal cleavage/methylation domain-containing protein, partial [Candidatus Xenobia bacterium]
MSRRAFTLIEVLTVTGLVALIVTLVCTAFISASRFSANAARRLGDETEMSRVAEQIREQLVCLNTSPVRLYPIQISTGGTRQDRIDFITSDLIKHGGVGDVAYEIDTDNRGRPYLAYRE